MPLKSYSKNDQQLSPPSSLPQRKMKIKHGKIGARATTSLDYWLTLQTWFIIIFIIIIKAILPTKGRVK